MPWASLLLIGALATFVGIMNYSATLVGAFTKLSLIVSAANLPLYVCCSFALFTLLRRDRAGTLVLALARGRGWRRVCRLRFLRPRLEAVRLGARLALGAAGLPIYLWMRRRQGAAPVAPPLR